MKNYFVFLLAVFMLFISFPTFAQSDKEAPNLEKVTITMKDGAVFSGVILQQSEQKILLRTANGEINLIAKHVRSIEKDSYTGKFRFTNPHDTRYFFGPSGIPIKKGKGYYQNIMVTTNFVNYGITQNISIGGGFEFLSLVLGESPIWFLTPKAGFKVADKVHAGGGVLMMGAGTSGLATLAYGTATLGSAESNVSMAIGYGFGGGGGGGESNFMRAPAIMVSGMHRVSNSISLLSENYAIPNFNSGYQYLGIQGVRIMSRRNSFDIGLLISSEIFEFIPALPYIGYVRTF